MHKCCPFTTLINGWPVLPVVTLWTVLQPVVVSILTKHISLVVANVGVLNKECKQACWCHIKPGPACQVCSIVLNNDNCTSDSTDVKTAPWSRDKTHTLDIRKVFFLFYSILYFYSA